MQRTLTLLEHSAIITFFRMSVYSRILREYNTARLWEIFGHFVRLTYFDSFIELDLESLNVLLTLNTS